MTDEQFQLFIQYARLIEGRLEKLNRQMEDLKELAKGTE